jgi:hypothetical protein
MISVTYGSMMESPGLESILPDLPPNLVLNPGAHTTDFIRKICVKAQL